MEEPKKACLIFLKDIENQNNVKLGQRKAGLLLGHFLYREMYYRESSLPRAAVNASLLMSFQMKYIKLL
jgi:hypothetical protein